MESHAWETLQKVQSANYATAELMVNGRAGENIQIVRKHAGMVNKRDHVTAQVRPLVMGEHSVLDNQRMPVAA